MDESEVREFLLQMRQPCIAMAAVEDQRETGSWLGGWPRLPEEIEWPVYRADNGVEVPLHFLAQIDLEACPVVAGLPPLPRTGQLLVFVEPIFAPFDTDGEAQSHDGKGMRIIHVNTGQEVALREPPSMPDISGVDGVGSWSGETWQDWWTPSAEPRRPVFKRKAVELVEASSYPFVEIAFTYDRQAGVVYPEDSGIAMEMAEDRDEFLTQQIEKLETSLPPEPAGISPDRMPENRHTIFGAPQIEVSQFWDGGALFAAAEPGSSEKWIKLFGFAKDDSIGFSGRGGSGLGVWIKRNALESGNFDHIRGWSEYNG